MSDYNIRSLCLRSLSESDIIFVPSSNSFEATRLQYILCKIWTKLRVQLNASAVYMVFSRQVPVT